MSSMAKQNQEFQIGERLVRQQLLESQQQNQSVTETTLQLMMLRNFIVQKKKFNKNLKLSSLPCEWFIKKNKKNKKDMFKITEEREKTMEKHDGAKIKKAALPTSVRDIRYF